MAKFPDPPAAGGLAAVSPDIHVLARGEELWRVYFRGGPHPTLWGDFRSFGPTRSRFDHHPPPPRVHASHRIQYVAASAVTALAEVFQDARVIDRVRWEPWLVAFRVTRDVSLLDLTGAWPTRAGASMNINSGPRPRAQRWSRRIHGDYGNVEGILYPSSMHANRPTVALYERCLTALPGFPTFHRALVDPTLLGALQNAALELNYRLR